MKGMAILVVLVLLMGIAAVACGCGEDGIVPLTPEDGVMPLTPEELIEGVLASADAQETCRFEMNVNGNLKGTVGGEYGEVGVSVAYVGVLDVVDQEMQADITMTMDVSAAGQSQQMSIPMWMYFLGDMGYIGTQEPGQPVEWIKGDVSQELWESQEFQSQQIELLRGAEVEILGTQSVRGIPCYAAEITPDMEMLLEMVNSMLGSTAGLGLTTDSISNFKCTGWYAQDTYFPMRVYQEYDITIEEGSDRLTGHYTANMVFYNYNEPVSIQLPAAAQGADYVGSLDWYLQ